MDQQELQQKIAEYYSKLPQNVQGKFSSMNWLETLKQISSKYNLKETQIQTLGTETTLVLLGILHFEEYKNILLAELGLEKSILENILVEINEEIFKDIRPDLDQTYKNHIESFVKERFSSTEELDKRFASLSKETQEAVIKSNYHAILLAISQKYSLTIDQIGKLEKMVTDILLGIIHADKFSNLVKIELNLQNEKNDSLIKDINTEIFQMIRSEIINPNNKPVQPAQMPTPPKIEQTARIKVKDNEILKQAGIEIMPEELGSGAPTQTKEIPAIQENFSMAKLAETFKIPATKTEYTLNNMSKSSNAKAEDTNAPQAPAPVQTPTQVPKPPSLSDKPKVDPYRMPIE